MALPVAVETEVEDCGSSCAIRSLLPDARKEEAEKVPNLMHYLHLVPIKGVGVPDYYDKLDRKLSDLEEKNLIYRVSDNLFVHILADPEDARDHYVAIEPAMLEDIGK